MKLFYTSDTLKMGKRNVWILKKKNEVVENNTMYAVANGTVIPISEVNDPVFHKNDGRWLCSSSRKW